MPTPEAIKRISEESEKLFVSKLKDYGTADVVEMGKLGIVTRIIEKALRLKNLLEKGEEANHESVYDTGLDIQGYGKILCLVEAGEWEGFPGGMVTAKEPKRIEDGQILIQRSIGASSFDLPNPKKEGDVGFDLYTVQDTLIPAHNPLPIDVPTGIKVKLPVNTFALIINRSSTPRKLGIEVVPGLIDNGYTGELFACCFNRTDKDIIAKRGTRLAQFIIIKSKIPNLREVAQLPQTERGETGFGSTGE